MWVERELLGLSPYGFLIRGSVDLTLSHQATQGGSINWLWRIVMDLHFTMPSWTSMKSEKHISLVQILTLETQHTSSTSSSFDYLHDLSWLPPYSQFHPMFFFFFFFRHHCFTLWMSLFVLHSFSSLSCCWTILLLWLLINIHKILLKSHISHRNQRAGCDQTESNLI